MYNPSSAHPSRLSYLLYRYPGSPAPPLCGCRWLVGTRPNIGNLDRFCTCYVCWGRWARSYPECSGEEAFSERRGRRARRRRDTARRQRGRRCGSSWSRRTCRVGRSRRRWRGGSEEGRWGRCRLQKPGCRLVFGGCRSGRARACPNHRRTGNVVRRLTIWRIEHGCPQQPARVAIWWRCPSLHHLRRPTPRKDGFGQWSGRSWHEPARHRHSYHDVPWYSASRSGWKGICWELWSRPLRGWPRR